MYIIYVLITILLLILALIVTSVRPIHGKYSIFELERRSKEGDVGATESLKREKYLSDIVSLQKILVNFILIALVILSIIFWGWLIGIAVSLLIGINIESFSRLNIIKNLSKKFYDKREKNILKFINKNQRLIGLIKGISINEGIMPHKVESKQELKHLVNTSDHILNSDEKKLISASIDFYDLAIKDVMTIRTEIIGVNRDEFLGPLNLNDLHKNGHNFLPVFGSGIDNIVGILDLKKLLNLDIKKSTIAEKVMENKVFYINENQDLYQGLVAFSRTHQHLLIVVNQDIETVGIVTQKDIVEAVVGKKISGDFDDYDNLKTVASKK